jgi:hypothetical protein
MYNEATAELEKASAISPENAPAGLGYAYALEDRREMRRGRWIN